LSIKTPVPRVWLLVLLSACSLTPIPDVTSAWVEPCPEAQRLCTVPFQLVAGNEQSAELRGDFRDGGWTQGEPMTKVDGGWSTSIPSAWGARIEYKFYLDDSRWILDPSNARKTPDGMGNTNSVLETVSCARWSCQHEKPVP
jgi:1,4-alpha-glucan branching enzyme